jgi:CRP-like cAMP-binding protein
MMAPLQLNNQQLRNIYLLASLSDPQLELMKQTSRQLQLKEGELLFKKGQPAECFFVVLRGHVKLTRLSLDGNEKVIEILTPRQTFAEAIMFRPQQVYPVTAQAVGDTEVMSFENKVFLGILEQSFDTCKRVMCDMSLRLHKWLNEIDELTLQNATYRLVNYLLYQIPKNHQGGPYEIHFEIPKHLIASRLSIKPETLSRILHQLTEEHLITVTGRTVTIHNVDKLRQYGQIWG